MSAACGVLNSQLLKLRLNSQAAEGESLQRQY